MVNVQNFIDRVGIRSHEELAEKIGATKSAVSSWSAGVRTPTYEKCLALLELGMTVEELFGKPYPSTAKRTTLELDEESRDALRRLLRNVEL